MLASRASRVAACVYARAACAPPARRLGDSGPLTVAEAVRNVPVPAEASSVTRLRTLAEVQHDLRLKFESFRLKRLRPPEVRSALEAARKRLGGALEASLLEEALDAALTSGSVLFEELLKEHRANFSASAKVRAMELQWLAKTRQTEPLRAVVAGLLSGSQRERDLVLWMAAINACKLVRDVESVRSLYKRVLELHQQRALSLDGYFFSTALTAACQCDAKDLALDVYRDALERGFPVDAQSVGQLLVALPRWFKEGCGAAITGLLDDFSRHTPAISSRLFRLAVYASLEAGEFETAETLMKRSVAAHGRPNFLDLEVVVNACLARKDLAQALEHAKKMMTHNHILLSERASASILRFVADNPEHPEAMRAALIAWSRYNESFLRLVSDHRAVEAVHSVLRYFAAAQRVDLAATVLRAWAFLLKRPVAGFVLSLRKLLLEERAQSSALRAWAEPFFAQGQPLYAAAAAAAADGDAALRPLQTEEWAAWRSLMSDLDTKCLEAQVIKRVRAIDLAALLRHNELERALQLFVEAEAARLSGRAKLELATLMQDYLFRFAQVPEGGAPSATQLEAANRVFAMHMNAEESELRHLDFLPRQHLWILVQWGEAGQFFAALDALERARSGVVLLYYTQAMLALLEHPRLAERVSGVAKAALALAPSIEKLVAARPGPERRWRLDSRIEHEQMRGALRALPPISRLEWNKMRAFVVRELRRRGAM